MKAISLFTGGKDSTYSIYEAKKQGFDVELLLSMNPEVKNSYLYHSKNIELTSLMADSMDMEIYEAKSRAKKEKEAEELKKAIKKVSREKNGFDSIIAGAIKSNYQKKRLHKIAKELDMDLYLPLWRINTKKYLKTLVKQDFEVIITSVSAAGLDKSFLGKKITYDLIKKLIKVKEKHYINLAGEGGEYETTVLNAPIFDKKIKIQESETIYDKEKK